MTVLPELTYKLVQMFNCPTIANAIVIALALCKARSHAMQTCTAMHGSQTCAKQLWSTGPTPGASLRHPSLWAPDRVDMQ